MTKIDVETARVLLQRAEEQLHMAEAPLARPLSATATEKLLHELQVQQIELEMQNEELLRIQAELDIERTQYFELYDLAPVAYLTLCDNGLIRNANLTAASLFGMARSIMLNKSLSILIWHEDQDVYYQQRKLIIDNGEPQSWQMRMKRADGPPFWAQLQAVKMHDGGCWLTVSDITSLKQAQEELLQAYQQATSSSKCFADLIEALSDWVWEVDSQGRYTYCSPQVESILGYRPDEIIGKTPFDLMSPLEAEHIQPQIDTIFRNKLNINKLENWAVSKDGRRVLLSTSGIPLVDASGNLTGYRGIDKDITEEKAVMEQLLHAQKMESIGELAGGLAHDLNNILTVINGYATLLQFETKQDETPSPYIKQILTATARAAALTHSLLTYSRKQKIDLQDQNLNQLIASAGSFINRIINENIAFTLSLADDPLVVNVDSVQIEQVLLNLATNARDAMPDGGTLSIMTKATSIAENFTTSFGPVPVGRYALISVTDSGHGMDDATRQRVFDPFFTTKEVGKGTGLGLAMAAGIIKQHCGFIDLQSSAGSGSVFRLYLPLVTKDVAVAAPAAAAVQMKKQSGTIMIVEDDECTRVMLDELLVRAGYTVVAAIDGQDAVEKFAVQKDEIQLVISDVVMPRKSGKEACDEIRQISAEMKFIFVSGHAHDVIEREGELAADADIIMKPVMPFELLQKVKELLQSS